MGSERLLLREVSYESSQHPENTRIDQNLPDLKAEPTVSESAVNDAQTQDHIPETANPNTKKLTGEQNAPLEGSHTDHIVVTATCY